MTNEAEQIVRRAAQFVSLLEQMEEMWQARTTNRDAFLILDEYPVRTSRKNAPFMPVDDDSPVPTTGNRRGGDTVCHYSQFSCLGDWFYMDLPDITLGPSEGQRLIQERPGFYYLKDRPDAPTAFKSSFAKSVQDWNPVQKCYRSGEKSMAAADLVYLWFSLWRVPVDWTFQAKLGHFSGGGNKILLVA